MTGPTDRLTRDYLERLERALAGAPRERRREIVDEIESHLREEINQLGHEPAEHEILAILDRIGDPDVIASAANEGDPKPSRGGALEIAAIIVLLAGGLVLPFFGWIVGVILLWISPVWNTRDKWIGTLVVPGGLAAPIYFLFFAPMSKSCSSGPIFGELPSGRTKQITQTTVCESSGLEPWISTLIFVSLALAAIGTAIYLGRRMRKASPLQP